MALGSSRIETFTQKRNLLLPKITVKGRLATQDDALTGNPKTRSAAQPTRVAGAHVLAQSMRAASATSFAQAVPVPKPAPKGRVGGAIRAGPSTTGATQTPPNPVIPDPRRNVPRSIFQTYDATQK